MTTEDTLPYKGPGHELTIWLGAAITGLAVAVVCATLFLSWPFIRAVMLQKLWKAERQEARAKRYWNRKRQDRETCAMADLECWFASQYPPMHTPKRWRTA